MGCLCRDVDDVDEHVQQTTKPTNHHLSATTMTEVKASSTEKYLGLYAKKDYESGDEILVESRPLLRLAPTSEEESEKLLFDWKGKLNKSSSKKSDLSTVWDAIVIDTDLPTGTLKGMVQAGLIWMKNNADVAPDTKKLLLDLYSPLNCQDLSQEKVCLDIAERAIAYLKANPFSGSKIEFDDWDNLRNIMMIWACNSFAGGRVYNQLSRVNHDCNPNAVILSNDEQQRLVAGTSIKNGEEITISYLGLMLYSDYETRQTKLKSTKFFECRCDRCKKVTQDRHDPAASIPCPDSYPRQDNEFTLDEDVQYDDDQLVTYVTLSSDKVVDKRLYKVLQSVSRRLRTYLDTSDGQPNKTQSEAIAGNDGGEEDEEDNDLMILEEHLSLSSSILGDKFWTTNLLRLLYLDRRLKVMSQNMITTQELPEIDDVAELIDSLERVSRYVDAIDLKLDPAHILGDVTIGIARTLVSLGDEKSCRYAAEWLDKVDEFVEKFGDVGLQKVVVVLKDAWKKHAREDQDSSPERTSKKSKMQ